MITAPDVVSIIGCGPSALQCGGGRAPGYRIAINGAAEYVAHDAALTMDGRFARECIDVFRDKPAWIRASAWDHVVRRVGAMSRWEGLRVYACDRLTTTFGNDECQLNGSNSGYIALNLAYVMRPKTVWLYGFDMNEPKRFFGFYPWQVLGLGSSNSTEKFGVWAREMDHAARQFKDAGVAVYNTNPNSRITAFDWRRPT